MNPFSRFLAAFKRPPGPRAEEPNPAIGRHLSPLQIKSIEATANAGNLTLAADLCHAFMADGRVQAALTQRIGGLLSLDLAFESGLKKSTRVLNAIEDDFFEAFNESDLFQLYSWGLLLGVGLGQITWDVGARGRLLPKIKVWNPRWLSFDFERDTWRVLTNNGDVVDIVPGDGQWILYTPKSSRAPWQHGLWRALNTPFFVKADGALDWARYNEVYGSPIRAFTGGQGISQRQLDIIASDLDTAKGFTSIALPQGSEFHLVEATGNTWDTFRESLQWASTEISIAILGQNLTSEVNGGSFAAAETHRDVVSTLIAFDAQSESTFLHHQLLRWWAIYNFGDAALAPWPMRDTKEPEDLTAKADLWRALGEAMLNLKAVGIPVDARAVAETFGLPLDKNASEAIATPKSIDAVDNDADAGKHADLILSSAAHAPKAIMAADTKQADEEDLPEGAARGFDTLDALERESADELVDIDAEQMGLILDIIERAQNSDELNERLESAPAKMESSALNGIFERASLIAYLSGHLSAVEDS